jgi:hypothetical protein
MATTPLEAEPEPTAIDPCGGQRRPLLLARGSAFCSHASTRFDRLIKARGGVWGCVSTGEKAVRALA